MLSWRLKKPYLVYCCVLGIVSLLLLAFHVYQGLQTDWDIGDYEVHWVAEVCEIAIGVVLVLETFVTLAMLGWRAFWTSRWCRFDLLVSLLTLLSFACMFVVVESGATLGENSVIDGVERWVEMPLLIARFALQPMRLMQRSSGTLG